MSLGANDVPWLVLKAWLFHLLCVEYVLLIMLHMQDPAIRLPNESFHAQHVTGIWSSQGGINDTQW